MKRKFACREFPPYRILNEHKILNLLHGRNNRQLVFGLTDEPKLFYFIEREGPGGISHGILHGPVDRVLKVQ